MVERQLHLFKGRRQQGERLPSPKELSLHIALASLLRRPGVMAPHWIFTHLPMGELRDARTAAKLKAMGVMAGWPDFIFIGKRARGLEPLVFFLELKREGERPTEEQKDVAAHLLACGCSYLMTSDIEDALGTLRDLGIVRVSVSA